jgi:drug/metabolite transporter (DMT)-like permease
MSATSAAPNAATRPLDAFAAAVVVALCLSWGFNQVSVKLAIHEIPPLTQAAIRSFGAAIVVVAWMALRRLPLFSRDGTLWAGLACGLFFGLEFVFIYQGLNYTTASRATLFIYLAPFFVVIGLRWVVPADGFSRWQWMGLTMSFVGMAVAFLPTVFDGPTQSVDLRQLLGDVLMVAAALSWALSTLIIKASALNRVSSEKTMMYQLVVSGPMLVAVAMLAGEQMDVSVWPSATALWALAYQTLYVVPITFVIWFALIVRYSAGRLSAFTFLTPLFGVAAGHFVLGDPVTPAFAAAVALVTVGLILVNRPR